MEKFSAVFEQVNDWWIGYVEELPGANTQGRSLDEARENLKETVQAIIETNRELTRRELHGKIFVQEELIVPALAVSDYRLQAKRAKI
jgi:predicted RNase H-like HicB family nuclease